MAPGNAPLALKEQEVLADLAPSDFQLSLPLTLREMGTQQRGVKWVGELVQLGVISNQGPALKGSRRLRVSYRLGSMHHLEGKRLLKIDFFKKRTSWRPLFADANMNSDVIFKVGPSFLSVGPGSHISRSMSGHNEPFIVSRAESTQEILMV